TRLQLFAREFGLAIVIGNADIEAARRGPSVPYDERCFSGALAVDHDLARGNHDGVGDLGLRYRNPFNIPLELQQFAAAGDDRDLARALRHRWRDQNGSRRDAQQQLSEWVWAHYHRKLS